MSNMNASNRANANLNFNMNSRNASNRSKGMMSQLSTNVSSLTGAVSNSGMLMKVLVAMILVLTVMGGVYAVQQIRSYMKKPAPKPAVA